MTKKKIDHKYPEIDYDKCTTQKVCVEVCPVNVFEVVEEGGEEKVVVARPEDCIQCRACVTNCPEKAIKLVGPD